jgi:hypothetical protein
MFKYTYFQIISYNFQVANYYKGVHYAFEVDFSQFYTTWGSSKPVYPFLRRQTHKCDSRGTLQNSFF